MPTLVIIDMQENDAVARSPGLVEKVVDLIRNAKKNNDAIIVVDFLTDVVGKVLPEIWEAIGVYPFAAHITKERYDGSENILKTCRNRGFYYGAIEICGIHSEVCVALTAKGLIAQGARVTIHKSAVADLYGEPLSWTKSEQGLFLCVVD